MFFLIALIVVRSARAADVARQEGSVSPAMLTDPLIAFALGMFTLTRLEMYLARQAFARGGARTRLMGDAALLRGAGGGRSPLGARRAAQPRAHRRGACASGCRHTGLVLEIASGTGEHVVYFAERFPDLEWQPSDVHPDALGSIAAWRAARALANVREADRARCSDTRLADRCSADAVLSINMVHISPWASALGLLAGAARILPKRRPLILYGPWLSDDDRDRAKQSGVRLRPQGARSTMGLAASRNVRGRRA